VSKIYLELMERVTQNFISKMMKEAY